MTSILFDSKQDLSTFICHLHKITTFLSKESKGAQLTAHDLFSIRIPFFTKYGKERFDHFRVIVCQQFLKVLYLANLGKEVLNLDYLQILPKLQQLQHDHFQLPIARLYKRSNLRANCW